MFGRATSDLPQQMRVFAELPCRSDHTRSGETQEGNARKRLLHGLRRRGQRVGAVAAFYALHPVTLVDEVTGRAERQCSGAAAFSVFRAVHIAPTYGARCGRNTFSRRAVLMAEPAAGVPVKVSRRFRCETPKCPQPSKRSRGLPRAEDHLAHQNQSRVTPRATLPSPSAMPRSWAIFHIQDELNNRFVHSRSKGGGPLTLGLAPPWSARRIGSAVTPFQTLSDLRRHNWSMLHGPAPANAR